MTRLDRTMLELRGRGLSYTAISTVLDLYEGVEATPQEVHARLQALGVIGCAPRGRPFTVAA